MSKANTFDTAIFTWHDPRHGSQQVLDTALYDGKLVITDIKGIDDWTISRQFISDTETAQQVSISSEWNALAFEIIGVIIDETKSIDESFRSYFATKELVRLQTVGYEALDRSFYISAFSLARYGNIRSFSISCVDAGGHISGAAGRRVVDFNLRNGAFSFPFSNRADQKFSFGSSQFLSSVFIHSDAFAETPFIFQCIFAGATAGFEISNDHGQALIIGTAFAPGDVLVIDMTNSVFRLTRADKDISILPDIDYANSTLFGIRQGDQTISIHDAPVAKAQIVFMEHTAP